MIVSEIRPNAYTVPDKHINNKQATIIAHLDGTMPFPKGDQHLVLVSIVESKVVTPLHRMAQEAEPDVAELLAQANAALHSANLNDMDTITVDDDDEDVNVELNDDDMNDPELLAQLAEFGDSDDNENVDEEDGDEKMFEEMKNKSLVAIKQVMNE